MVPLVGCVILPEAIVMMNVDIGKESEVFEKVLKIDNVKEAYMVYGIHDIVAVVEANSMDELRELITNRIRKIDGVKSTLTAIVVVKKMKG